MTLFHAEIPARPERWPGPKSNSGWGFKSMLGSRSSLLVRNEMPTIWLLHCGVSRQKGVHDLGGSSGSAVAAARRTGYPWTEQMARKMLRNVEKRGVHAARNGHGSKAGHSSEVADVDARRRRPRSDADALGTRWLSPARPPAIPLVTREDPGVEPCLIACGPSLSLSRLPAWPVLRCPLLVRPGIGSTLHA